MQAASTGLQRVGPLVLLAPALAEFAVSAASVLSGCGLAEDALASPEKSIPYIKCGELLHACTRATGCNHFALLLGARASWQNLGPLGLLLRNSPTVDVAVRTFVANHHLYSDGGMLYLWGAERQTTLGYAVYNSGQVDWAPMLTDMILSAAHQIIFSIAGILPAEILLARKAPVDHAAYERHFQAPVRFGAEQSCILYATEAFKAAIEGARPDLRALALSQADARAGSLRPTMLAQVQRTIFPRLLSGDVSASAIAADLGLTPRTLHRRLRDQDTSFQAEVHRLRFELSRQLLANTRLTITQIALALGYSQSSAFTRAFREWSGTVPRDWRSRPAGW
jgi:AraC-like DNA-binding protein